MKKLIEFLTTNNRPLRFTSLDYIKRESGVKRPTGFLRQLRRRKVAESRERDQKWRIPPKKIPDARAYLP